MPIASYDFPIPFELSTPAGTCELNAEVTLDSGTGLYLLNPQACKSRVGLRVTNTNLPQKDGVQLHRRWLESYEIDLAVQMWSGLDTPACDELLQDMVDNLMLHVRAFQDPPDAPDARVYWTPEGKNQRMIKRARIDGDDEADLTIENGVTQIKFTVRSPYPYAWDASETTTAISATLTNGGTAEFWPVIKVFGPASTFTITNTSVEDDDGNPLVISYDSGQTGASAIGGGDYVEIDTFFETLYLNGDGANMKPGLVMLDSDFFPVAPGANNITISGATADVLWQNAWA